MREPLVTVVIPIYNIRNYITKCIKSVITQTYQNLEIILVDDGSVDGSEIIVDKYGKKDKRIIVIHKKNGGLSDARNAGIGIARGEYIFLLDGDDFLMDGAFKTIVSIAVSNNLDIISSGYIKYYDGDREIRDTRTDWIRFDKNGALENLLYQRIIATSAWGKLYKRSLFREIKYPVGEICEDLATTYRLYGAANATGHCFVNTVFYRQRDNSIIRSSFNKNRMRALDFTCELIEYIDKNFPNLHNAAVNRMFMEAIFISGKIPLANSKYKKYRKQCSKIVQRTRMVVFCDNKSSAMQKGYAIVAIFGYCSVATLYKTLIAVLEKMHGVRHFFKMRKMNLQKGK